MYKVNIIIYKVFWTEHFLKQRIKFKWIKHVGKSEFSHCKMLINIVDTKKI